MSLVKKSQITEEKSAANQRNGTIPKARRAGRKKRSRPAPLRHGLYAKWPDVALRCLGEDPAEFEELLRGLYQEFRPRGALQKALVNRLARLVWLMERADRSQEGHAMGRAKSADRGRDNRLHARMMRLKMTAETLRSLACSVAVRHYVTTREDLEVMKKLHQEGVTTEMGEIALALFYQLQEPGTDEDGVSELEKARRVVENVKWIFGIGQTRSETEALTPAGGSLALQGQATEPEVAVPPEGEEGEDTGNDGRYPAITAEDWEARERARRLLRNILARQAENCEAQRKALLKESLAGPSPFELAAEVAPSHVDAWLIRRTQDLWMREIRRLVNLLLKLKRETSKEKRLKREKRSAKATMY
jgi:hypothetical protein